MKLRTSLLAAVALFGTVAAANAVPVTGQISITGNAQAVGSAGMGMATGINFSNAAGTSVTGTTGQIQTYSAGTGSFLALGACASVTTGCGTIKDIASFGTSAPISQFLVLATGVGTTVSFDLSSISTPIYTMDATGGSVKFTAAGIINFTGFDATAGVFSLTAQGNQITSFSATTLASAVPEPASLAILGTSLAAVGLVRRRKA